MSVFDEALRAGQAAVDEAMAERFVLTPKARGLANAPDVADTSRAASYEFCGHWRDRELKPTLPDSYDARQFRRPGVEAGSVYIKISVVEMERQIQRDPTFAIKQTDVITRLKDGSKWRATAPFIMSAGAYHVHMNLFA